MLRGHGDTGSGHEGWAIGALAQAVVPPQPTRYESDCAAIEYLPSVNWGDAADVGASGGSYRQTSVGGQHRTRDVHRNGALAPGEEGAGVRPDERFPGWGAAIPVDLYATTVADQQVVRSSPAGLADTEHTVLVTCSYSKSTKSTGYEVNLDALDVVGTLPNPVVHVGLVDEGMRLDPAWSLP